MNSNGQPAADIRKASLVAVLTTAMDVDPARLTELDRIADSIEVRADQVGDLDPARLRHLFHGRLVYSLGPAAPGGDPASSADRTRRLVAAGDAGYDIVDLRWPYDATPEVLARIPPARRRVSWHGPPASVTTLRGVVGEMRTTPAALYLVCLKSEHGALAALRLLKALDVDDVSAFAIGAGGLWSRVLAPWLGAPVAFGRAASDDNDNGVSAPDSEGMPTLAHLIDHYGLPDLPQLEGLYGIVGLPRRRTASPLLHNAAYRSLGLPALYLSFGADSLVPFWADVIESGLDELGLRLRGATITSPHKEDALLVADEITGAAGRAGAANLLTRGHAGWNADTMDSSGVMAALAQAGVDPAGQAAAVVGCGGAGRAAAAALVQAGAQVTLVNRSPERGRLAAALLDLPFLRLQELDPSPYSLIVHATPLHREAPFDVAQLADGTTVLDMVYGRWPTRLIREARERDLVAVDGWAVLMAEVKDQFRSMTGLPMPADVVERMRAMGSHTNGHHERRSLGGREQHRGE